MNYQEKYEIGSNVTAKRTFNGEIITGEFGGFYLLDKSNPKSIVGVVHTTNGGYYDVKANSIKPVISEDEKIRKEIISFLRSKNGFMNPDEDCDFHNRWLPWLKKQDEQPNKVSIWKHWKDGIAGNGDNVPTYLIRNGSTYSISSCLGFECDYIELSELDSLTQNPADEVESKFHEGDWIINQEGTLRHIIAVGRTGYETNEGWLSHDYYDKSFHLWTIQDAKDGDVLADDNSIIIFRSIGNHRWNDVIDYYVSYKHNLGEIVIQSGDSHYGTVNTVTFKPAAKEQRNLLFQKMKEAGYEWDAEKKELKRFEQNPAWSEEDMETIDRIYNFIWKNRKGDTSEIYQQEKDAKWLKSFKGRIQTQLKQESDAFIKKACEWLGTKTMTELCLSCDNKKLVKEFIEDFKNYMKGE